MSELGRFDGVQYDSQGVLVTDKKGGGGSLTGLTDAYDWAV